MLNIAWLGGGGPSVSTDDLGDFVATVRYPSAVKSFDITGEAGTVSVPNSEWQISLDGETWVDELEDVADATVYVRYAPTQGSGIQEPGGDITVGESLTVAVAIPGKNPLVLDTCLAWTPFDLAHEFIDEEEDVDIVRWPVATKVNDSNFDLAGFANGTLPQYMLDSQKVRFGVGVGVGQLRSHAGESNEAINDWLEGVDDISTLAYMSSPGQAVSGVSVYHNATQAIRLWRGSAGDHYRWSGITYFGDEPLGLTASWYGIITPRNAPIRVYRNEVERIGGSSTADIAFSSNITYVIYGDISASGLVEWHGGTCAFFSFDIGYDRSEYQAYFDALQAAAATLS